VFYTAVSGFTGASKKITGMTVKGFRIILLCCCLLLTGLFACNDGSNSAEILTKGTIDISVDESFKPVISEQVKVFESSYPDAKVRVTYKSEADCLKDMDNDSVHMIITAKGLTQQQETYYTDKLSYTPRFGILAYDAVAVILNREATDSLFTIADLNHRLTGKDTTREMIMDGTNATSTVRYMIDSVTKGKAFGKNVVAAKGSEDVIRYISGNRDAIGFVGLSWVGNPQDPQQAAMTKNIRFALLACRLCADSGMYAAPAQSTIAMNQYPLTRPLYFILKENAAGIATALLNFMSLERGQLIFRRAFLQPAKMNFNVRKSNL
jgi:phosphate transport system substrate-binding protein